MNWWKFILILLCLLVVGRFYVWVLKNIHEHKAFRDQVITEAIKVFFVVAAGIGLAVLANWTLPAIILKNQTQFEINKNALDTQNALAQKTLSLIYTPFYNILRVSGDVQRGDLQGLEASWDQLQESMVNWNIERPSVVSQLAIQFGYPLADEIQTDLKHSSVNRPISIQDQLSNAAYEARLLRTCFINNCPSLQSNLQSVKDWTDVLYDHIDSFQTKLTGALIAKEKSLTTNPFGTTSTTTDR